MIVAVQMDFLVRRPSGIFAYRRRVPKELKLALGKREIQFSLQTKDQETAMRLYAEAHAKAEAELAKASKVSPRVARYEATRSELIAAGLWVEGEEDYPPARGSDDSDRRQAHAEHLQDIVFSETKEEQAVQNANPDGRFERAMVAMLRGVQKPRMTLRDAFSDYCKANAYRRTASRLAQDGERVISLLCEIMGEPDPEVRTIKRTHALTFRDTLIERGSKPNTVQRRVNSIKAILNHAISEGREEGLVNYFNDLKVPNPGRGAARELREALSVEEILLVNEKITLRNEDVQDIWQLLVYTGARVAEIRGLEWKDVFLDVEVPHIFIRANDTRDVKTASSKRRVPLVGVALRTLRRRSEELVDPVVVFPRYAGERGSDAASQLMLKAMKQAGVWQETRKVVHSLRHAHKDWMRRVAPADICDLMHGHSSGSASASYGSDHRLEQLRDALADALRVAGVEG